MQAVLGELRGACCAGHGGVELSCMTYLHMSTWVVAWVAVRGHGRLPCVGWACARRRL